MHGKIKDKYPFIINILSYAAYQFVNLLILIIMIPFFISTYGVDKFGIISIAQGVGIIVAGFCDYNYMITGVREIATNHGNNNFISKKITESIISKIIICCTLFIFGTGLFYCFESTRNILSDLQIGIIYGFSISFIPVWALNALHFNLPLAIFSAPIRLISIFLIYQILKNKNDYYLVNIYLTIGNLFASIVIYKFLSIKKSISYNHFSLNSIISNFQKGVYLCLSNICASTYMNIIPLILSLYVSPYFVGIYSLADKIINGGRQILSISSNIIYPYTCKAIMKKQYVKNFFIPAFGTILLLISSFVFVTFLFRIEILSFIGNERVAIETELIFIILLCTLPIVATNIPFTHYLYATRRENTVSMIAIIICIGSLISNIFISKYFGITGTSALLIITELCYSILLMYKTFRSRLIL
jgi:PST family polysaccharide transporter